MQENGAIIREALPENFKKAMDKKNELLRIQGVKNKDWSYFLDLIWFLPVGMLIRFDKYRYIKSPEQEGAEMNEEDIDQFFTFERSDFDSQKHNR